VARFFWVNSGMRLALTPLVLVSDAKSPAAAEDVSFEQHLRKAEHRPADYRLRVTAIFQQEWQPQARLYALASGHGEKLFPLREPEAGFGFSWFRIDEAATGPLARALYRQLRHSLSASRAAELPPEGLGPEGASGDGLDALARLLREQPPATWAAAGRALGRILDAPDRDGDGMPDRAGEAPLDEERFGSDPAKPDTDGDGLSDFDEARARIWIDRGERAEKGGRVVVPDPRRPDSDGDGLPDGRDPEPLFPYPTRLEPGTVTIDGRLEAREWDPLGRIDDRDMKAELFARWNRDGLGLAARLDRLGWVQLQLDGAGDGWYRGRENLGVNLYWQSHRRPTRPSRPCGTRRRRGARPRSTPRSSSASRRSRLRPDRRGRGGWWRRGSRGARRWASRPRRAGACGSRWRSSRRPRRRSTGNTPRWGTTTA